jgi:hypothetical protein
MPLDQIVSQEGSFSGGTLAIRRSRCMVIIH